MQRRWICLVIVLLVGIAVEVSRADDNTYNIVLTHPTDVGRMFLISGTATTGHEGVPKQKDAKPLASTKHTFALDAKEKVLAVEPNTKLPCKVELTVKK